MFDFVILVFLNFLISKCDLSVKTLTVILFTAKKRGSDSSNFHNSE